MRVMRAYMVSRLAAFRADERATMTVEFCISFPLLMVWFLGSFVFWDGFRSRSHSAKAAYTVSDILSRYSSVSDANLDELYSLQQKMLPRSHNSTALRMTSICFREGADPFSNTDDEYFVVWSEGRGIAQPMKQSEIPFAIIPAMSDGDSIVLTESWAPWRPLVDWVGISDMVWESHLVTRPRFVELIAHKDVSSSNLCPSAST
ncbi:TadE/TadG family type IV pilus assembly protein [Oceanomicrobium pacificus]|uniref:Pilus assembly protein n=1 Tax=Oceanomicrobium pacificus TaxID=2692916 RepID=A0A6B0TM73_9RHOB|nr:hypothetical protein [Oceanomicrobium pacificus]MXU64996.1 hypothetical protein [Oceanomicrobium pacificus]